ncbi:MAG: PilZ domain-containing protein [Acidobacteriota bacterium]|nr:PilZ domain-containing protein [Acidobacteriota bacterium]MDQ5872944.1 PilZ domain-containing protein [Acidobacteriota bacterium]
MAERRRFPRIRKRILVSFKVGQHTGEGFTNDLGPTGIFVRSIFFPKPGSVLRIRLKSPAGEIALRAAVVRSYRVPMRLSAYVPSGFIVRVLDPPEAYFELLARFFRIAA